MSRLYPIGTLIRLADRRMGRIVYNGLDGQGINLQETPLTDGDMEILEGTCPLFEQDVSEVPDHLFPQVMLREPYKCQDMECVPDYEEAGDE